MPMCVEITDSKIDQNAHYGLVSEKESMTKRNNGSYEWFLHGQK